MRHSAEFWDELQSMKTDIAQTLNATAEGLRQASSPHLDALSEQIRSGLSDFTDVLKEEEEQLERFVATRPIAALASAFVLGILVGFSFRRTI